MTPLTRLLQSRMDENRWKLRDVVRPPDGVRKGAPARATMSQHLQPGYWLSTMPRPATIEQLAIAVRVAPEVIREAAYLSLASNQGAVRGSGQVQEARVQVANDEPGGVIAAIQNDPDLLPEARLHLLNQYGLLRRLRPEPTEAEVDAEAEIMLTQVQEAARRKAAPRPKPL